MRFEIPYSINEEVWYGIGEQDRRTARIVKISVEATALSVDWYADLYVPAFDRVLRRVHSMLINNKHN